MAGWRPKKWIGEIKLSRLGLYPSEQAELLELRILWKELNNTDTIRKAIKYCLEKEKQKKV